MINLGINAIGTRHSGAATVLLTLLEKLLQNDDISKIIVFASPKEERFFQFPSNEKLSIVDAPNITSNIITRFIWLRTYFRRYIIQQGCDAVYNMNNLAGPVPVPQALFLQQSLYFSREAIDSYFSSDIPNVKRLRMRVEPKFMLYLYRRSAAVSQAIVVQTNTMRKTVCRQLKIDEVRVHVVPPTFHFKYEQENTTAKLESMREPGFIHWLYVGNDPPYKNLSIIYRVSQLAMQKEKRWRFHLIGILRNSLDTSSIYTYSYVNRHTLNQAYSLANGLIMPSLTETVGLPLVEALSHNIPIIAADRPYAHEVCGESAMYFDPYSVNDLYQKLCIVEHNHNKSELDNMQSSYVRTKHINTNTEVWDIISKLINEYNAVAANR